MTRLTVRLFTACVMLYLALDCAAPSLPGALVFDADESIEVVRTEGLDTARAPMVAMEPTQAVRITPVAAPRTMNRRPSQITRDGATPDRPFARSAPAQFPEDA